MQTNANICQLTETNRRYWDKRFWLISELVYLIRVEISGWFNVTPQKLYVPKEHSESLVAITCKEVMQTVYDIYHGKRPQDDRAASDVAIQAYEGNWKLKFINKEDVIFELDFHQDSVVLIVNYYSHTGERKRLVLQVSELNSQ